MIRAVTFDFWDTLVGEAPGQIRGMQIHRWLEILRASGTRIDRETLVEAFDANWVELERRWANNLGQHTPVDATDFICARIGLSPDGLREDLADTFRSVGEHVPVTVAPGVSGALQSLKEAGLSLGIVCDVGLTPSAVLRLRLDRFGLLGYFDSWSFSDETGWFKPAAGAFEPALEGLGVAAEETAHVGDWPRTDVVGALAMGMTAVRYTGFSDRVPNGEPEAHFVTASHAEIPGFLLAR